MRGTIEKRRPDYKVSGIRCACIYIYIKHIVYSCLHDKRGGVSLRFVYYVETRLMRNSFKI